MALKELEKRSECQTIICSLTELFFTSGDFFPRLNVSVL